jgi:hypothetical protein
MAGIYGDEFEKNMNVLTSPANIKETARKFVEFERRHWSKAGLSCSLSRR